MELFSILLKILIYGVPILFAVTLHEVAHGWVALKCGDSTAKLLGRLTLNPLKHIDLVGTIIVPLVLLFTTGFMFGWAKPVPVVWHNLKNPKRDMAFVAIAGPLSNFVMALLWGILLKLLIVIDPSKTPSDFILAFMTMAQVGIFINLILMVLNILPIPPLDGSRVLSSLVSPRIAHFLGEMEVYGFLILVILIISGVLITIMKPIIQMLLLFLQTLLGL